MKCATPCLHFKDVCESKFAQCDLIWEPGLFRDTPVKMRLLVCVLIHYDWCPYTKRTTCTWRTTYTGRLRKRCRGQCETGVGEKHVQTKDHQISKQTPRNQESPREDFPTGFRENDALPVPSFWILRLQNFDTLWFCLPSYPVDGSLLLKTEESHTASIYQTYT